MTPIARLLSLRVALRDAEAAAEVTPEALVAYAERAGWTLATTTGAHRVYHRGDRHDAELQVPLHAGWPDYGRAVLREIAELATVEGRSELAVWAELVGWRDPAAAAARDLDEMLGDMVTRAAMWAQTPEALLFQALLALRIRAMLRGEPDPDDAYQAAKKRRRIPAALHACDRLDLAGVVALVAELVGLPAPETPPPYHDVAPGEATGATGGPEVVQPPTGPATAQETLPGVEPPRRVRSRPVHRWGLFAREQMPSTPLDPDRSALVQRCPHCTALRRRANTGSRLGAQDMYSTDGGESWWYKRPPCVVK